MFRYLTRVNFGRITPIKQPCGFLVINHHRFSILAKQKKYDKMKPRIERDGVKLSA